MRRRGALYDGLTSFQHFLWYSRAGQSACGAPFFRACPIAVRGLLQCKHIVRGGGDTGSMDVVNMLCSGSDALKKIIMCSEKLRGNKTEHNATVYFYFCVFRRYSGFFLYSRNLNSAEMKKQHVFFGDKEQQNIMLPCIFTSVFFAAIRVSSYIVES